MSFEEYTIRILPTGEIIVEGEAVDMRVIKDLAEYLRETLGPIRVEQEVGDDAGGRVQLFLDEFAGREAEQDVEKERLKLRND
jgi:hypothetical protein